MTRNNCEIFSVTKVYHCQTYPSHNVFVRTVSMNLLNYLKPLKV